MYKILCEGIFRWMTNILAELKNIFQLKDTQVILIIKCYDVRQYLYKFSRKVCSMVRKQLLLIELLQKSYFRHPTSCNVEKKVSDESDNKTVSCSPGE